MIKYFLSQTIVTLKIMRVEQWIKNTFMLIPLFFSGHLLDYNRYGIIIFGFLSFCLIASCIYIINDYFDLEADKIHPIKKSRPLASNQMTPIKALILATILGLTGTVLAAFLNYTFLILILTYIIINLLYSTILKRISILDIIILASGFQFRIFAGGILMNIEISHWLSIMVMLLAMLLALAKRRDDLILTEKSGLIYRHVSKGYSLEFINSCLTLFSGIIVIAYIMYTVSFDTVSRLHNRWLYTTSLFVISGIMRYLQITFVENRSGSPTKIVLNDPFTIINLLLWVLSFYLIIYIL